ncbi:NAC domain-containing protein 72 [Nymphaea thermarum]|nr:NAC domain-containing protein 72 [Nymphaea thermarum]
MEGTGDEMYLPPGFRFHPTDEELLVQYLLPKTSGLTFSSNVIADVHLYRHDPWDLPGKGFYGDNEWYFFSRRDRKFPNGSRPNWGAGSGFWKATGTDKTIVFNGRKVGTKKALVFYVGKPQNGSKTNWIMHEYQLLDDNGCLPQKKATPSHIYTHITMEGVADLMYLPRGFRFHPSDEELLLQYLLPKTLGMAFSHNATGTDKTITSGGRKVGVKKSLLFYIGKPPNGSKTNWIMHEYKVLPEGESGSFPKNKGPTGMEGTGDEMYLPPGFRFHPTDEELLVHYLLPKTSGFTFYSEVIADVHLYRHDPWDLPGKAFFGDNEWYFFSPRDRKFPNGSRPNRAAGSGFWKATGTDKTIVADGRKVGIKKAFVFYVGKPFSGSKTNWIMHEYQLLLDDNGCLRQNKATPPWMIGFYAEFTRSGPAYRRKCKGRNSTMKSPAPLRMRRPLHHFPPHIYTHITMEGVADLMYLPRGFRFHPSDEELLLQYLLPKTLGMAFFHNLIADINLYRYDPWVLPGTHSRTAFTGAGSGFWKATGTDKSITSGGRKVGVKKSLVFYIGKPPNGSKTNWIMHEYKVLTEGENGSFPKNKGPTGVSGDWRCCSFFLYARHCPFFLYARHKKRERGMEGTGDEVYLPPGFRFHPTDEELLIHYLLPKTTGLTFYSNVIADVHLYRHDPWDLPGKAFFGDNEWYFFSPRDRKFPNGSRPNRAAGSGFWKATGTDKTIVADGRKVGIKKALVFYVGKPFSGSKTNWIMHEYQLLLDDNGCLRQNKATPRLDDWVLCRIYKKRTSLKKEMQRSKQHDEIASSPSDEETFASLPACANQRSESNVNQWTTVPEMNAGYQQQLTCSSDFNLSTEDFFMELPTYMANNSITPTPLSLNLSTNSFDTIFLHLPYSLSLGRMRMEGTGDQIYLPPGFRFDPTDEELLVQYLFPKNSAATFSSNVIGDVDLYRHDPWDLTGASLTPTTHFLLPMLLLPSSSSLLPLPLALISYEMG